MGYFLTLYDIVTFLDTFPPLSLVEKNIYGYDLLITKMEKDELLIKGNINLNPNDYNWCLRICCRNRYSTIIHFPINSYNNKI